MSVSRNNDIITFTELSQPTLGSDLTALLLAFEKEGKRNITLDFSQVKRIYPNTAIPLATILNYFSSYLNFSFTRIDDNQRITERNILNPLIPTQEEKLLISKPLNKIWCFNSSQDVNVLVNTFVANLRRAKEFNPGFLDTLDWSLYEVMDNVLQHSGKSYGFVMGQIHHQRKHVAFCIGDCGQGIYNSLKNSIYQPENAIEAIKIAIKESITRDKAIGQGNGMYGLHQIVNFNKGRLTIISNTALYKLEDEKIITLPNIPTISDENGGTIIDFQLNYQNKVTIQDALIFNGKPHTNYVNYYLENLENEEGDLAYLLKDWQDGVGTRPSGKKLRIEILNNYKETHRRISIDFAHIRVVSSSFADELLGKLVVELGFFNFNNLVKLKNMNQLIQQIVQRSVAQRMAESMKTN